MTDATEAFFRGLEARDHEPLLAKATGTLRFDLADGGQTDHWLVAVHKGAVAVSHGAGEADLVLHTERKLFDEVVRGEANLTAALLRGAVGLEGQPQLIVLFQRLFPARQLDG
jgi:putative sterol carrier protein